MLRHIDRGMDRLGIAPQHARIVRFLISGALSAISTLVLTYIFTEWMHLWYVVSGTLAFAITLIQSYLLQKFWTFAGRSGARYTHRQFVSFALLQTINAGLNALGLYVLVEYAHLWYMAASVVVMLVIAVWSYMLMHGVIFNNATESATP